MGHALNGIRVLLATQPNARVHLAAALVVCAAGVVLRIGSSEWCLVTLAIGLVLAAEALNTGIEFVCDALHPEHHPLIGKAKDAAAAGVLISALSAAAVGVMVFAPAVLR